MLLWIWIAKECPPTIDSLLLYHIAQVSSKGAEILWWTPPSFRAMGWSSRAVLNVEKLCSVPNLDLGYYTCCKTYVRMHDGRTIGLPSNPAILASKRGGQPIILMYFEIPVTSATQEFHCVEVGMYGDMPIIRRSCTRFNLEKISFTTARAWYLYPK